MRLTEARRSVPQDIIEPQIDLPEEHQPCPHQLGDPETMRLW